MGEFVLGLPLTGFPVLGLRQRSCTTSSKGRMRPWPSCGTCYTETIWDSLRYVLESLRYIRFHSAGILVFKSLV